ncbi:MAG: peptide/nickel transport system permease protein [Gaiellaceae bacterium]|nr:peptide/nickel transport system permease protein [Gaiellaceae bacterium]
MITHGMPRNALRRSRSAAWGWMRDPQLATAAGLIGLLVAVAVLGPVLWDQDAVGIDLGATLQAPSWAHPMGTDDLGRDVFARFMSGARISLTIGLVAVLAGSVIGGAIGLLAGALSGAIDLVSMRVMDAILAFPPLILAMAVTVGLGAGLTSAAIGIVLTSIPFYARLTRADVVRIRSANYIEAAGTLGATRMRVICRHIVPNAIVSVPILAAANFGYVILTLAALGFVGLGAQIPTPEWGAMITQGQEVMLTGAWWIGVFPGLGLLIAVTATSILADRVRDLLDPSGRRAGGALSVKETAP